MKRLVVPETTLARQRAASDPSVSAWVGAHAGSGKTHVLAQRVIRLMLAGADPARILCLTYTKAAAANMANRVFETLGRWTMLPDDTLAATIAEIEGRPSPAVEVAKARALFARALETPGGLKIQTIHAFCEAILHQFPLEANIAGNFDLLDGQKEVALVGEARRLLLQSTAAGADPTLTEAFAEVLARGGEAGLDGLLGEIVRRRDAVRDFIGQADDGSGAFEPLFREFGFGPGDGPDAAFAGLWPDAYFDAGLAADLSDRAMAAGRTGAADFAAQLAAACGESDFERCLEFIRDAFLTKSGSVRSTRSLTAKGVGEHFPDLADQFERFAADLVAALERRNLLAMLHASRAALIVADRLIARYEQLKAARGLLDFNDLIQRTIRLLARTDAAAWVQYRLDRGIDHILVDEAQDTSPDQWEVIRILAGEFFAGRGARDEVERTIFAVGDEKQSIYSFQGARPEAFAASGAHFGGKARDAGLSFRPVRLSLSFRSTRDVLAAVDRVFADAQARKGLMVEDEAPLAHDAIRDTAPGYVELWPSLGAEQVPEPDDWTIPVDHASAPAVRLAERIARMVARWLGEGETIEGKGRPLAAGDVLVLVRKRDSFVNALSRALKNRGVAVAGADRLRLQSHIAVKDLVALGRVLVQPADDLSLAALLRSPIFGLTDETLFELAWERGDGVTLEARLAASADPALRAVADRLAGWRAEAANLAPFDFYARLMARDGLRRTLLARLGEEAGEVLDEFLNFCLAQEQAGLPGLEPFLATLDASAPEIKRELDQGRDEVRIMTVHAAKGLEAPVVFLVDSGGQPFVPAHLPRLIGFPSKDGEWRGHAFLWRAGKDVDNGFARSICEEIAEKAEEEYRRLLYVGMTRAEDRLIVAGYHGKRPPGDMNWHALVRRALEAAEGVAQLPGEDEGETVLRYRVTPQEMVAAEESGGRAAFRPGPVPAALRENAATPANLPRPLQPSGVSATIGEVPPPVTRSPVLEAQASPSFAAERGIAAHRLLQVLPGLPAETRAQAAERYLARAGAGWSEAERAEVLRSVLDVLGDPRFSALFSPGARAEVAVMGAIRIGGRERAVSGKIDRLLVAGDHVLIADFKTGPAPAHADAVPETHLAQMALYAALCGRIFPGRRVEAALIHTEGPALFRLDPERLARALASLGAGAGG